MTCRKYQDRALVRSVNIGVYIGRGPARLFLHFEGMKRRCLEHSDAAAAAAETASPLSYTGDSLQMNLAAPWQSRDHNHVTSHVVVTRARVATKRSTCPATCIRYHTVASPRPRLRVSARRRRVKKYDRRRVFFTRSATSQAIVQLRDSTTFRATCADVVYLSLIHI